MASIVLDYNTHAILERDHTGKIIPPVGSAFSLEEKLSPVCEGPPPYKAAYAVTRGRIDVTEFKRKLESLPPEYWEDSYQQREWIVVVIVTYKHRLLTTIVVKIVHRD